MFASITNTPRDYAWGSPTAIAELLGRPASGGPEAELWLGTHPGSPSRLVVGGAGGGVGVAGVAAGAAGGGAVGSGTLADLVPRPLPFLLKVLAAAAPLSLQAHPNQSQAREGFLRENALGIPVDSPTRNYKDDQHKPELIYALADDFRALCGFRSVAAVRASLAGVGGAGAGAAAGAGGVAAASAGAGDTRIAPLLDRLVGDDSLPAVFEWLIGGGGGRMGAGASAVVDHAVDSVVDPEVAAVVAAVSECDAPGQEWDTVRLLAAEYPGDPGIAISLLLNTVTLRAGEALYLAAGSIHAYLGGLGIEIMAASDNVLRGGLTPKRIDVPELLSVLDFRPEAVTVLHGETEADGVVAFRPPVAEFSLRVVTATADVPLAGPGILLCTAGEFVITGAASAATIRRGGALYVSADEGLLHVVTDGGTLFVASVGG